MPISLPLAWLVAALALGALEMLSGTFYLLVLGLGCLVLAALTWLFPALSVGWQLAILAAIALIGCFAVHRLVHSSQGADQAVQNPDLGQRVQILSVGPDGMGLAEYRGARWRARPVPGHALRPGPARIELVDGVELVARMIS